jgi:hypothetical protein
MARKLGIEYRGRGKLLRGGQTLRQYRWCREMLEQMAAEAGNERSGEERRESEAERAERIALKELRVAGCNEGWLASTGNRVKVRQALWLRAETPRRRSGSAAAWRWAAARTIRI